MRAATPHAVLLCILLAAGCGASDARTPPQVAAQAPATSPAGENPGDPALRIRFYEAKLQEHPTLFAGHAELGAAYLDRARETHDVSWLARAHASLERSLELQPNPNAFASLAALCNFSHRFACALENAERAARGDPTAAGLRALRIEAHLGLGELQKAEQLIDASGATDGAAFALPAARGRWLAEQKRFDEALQAFVEAARQARGAGASELTLWAEVNAAGTMIDSGRPALARPHLEAATGLLPASWSMEALLKVHWAELHDLEQRPAEALREYESILTRQPDPEIYRRAYLLARKLGQDQRAVELFEAGDAAAERIAKAGEIFALEAQARLYADAGVKLDAAERIALQNLEHKRDRSAHETLAHVRTQRALLTQR
jgi:tetratricopeptide (TPR) repeat protein